MWRAVLVAVSVVAGFGCGGGSTVPPAVTEVRTTAPSLRGVDLGDGTTPPTLGEAPVSLD